MALNIPMPRNFGDSLLQGFQTGSNFFDRLVKNQLTREDMARRQKQFEEEMALRKQAASRSGRNDDLQRAILQERLFGLQRSNDPMTPFNNLKTTLDSVRQMQQGEVQQDPTELQSFMPNFRDTGEPFATPELGEQALSPFDAHNQNQPQTKNTLPFGLDEDEIKRALVYKSLGLKPTSTGTMKEPPQIKRANDLKAKMDEAEYKHNLKLAEQKQASDLKNEETRNKTITSAKNDVIHLEDTLRSLKIMEKIAEDSKNEDMFGHWWLGHDKAAQRITNPNAGVWQVQGLGPIIDAEMKMSSRGNQLALKSALNNKPNFGEAREVALSKIKSSIDQVKKRLEDSKKVANMGNSLDFSKMSDDELRAIVGGQ